MPTPSESARPLVVMVDRAVQCNFLQPDTPAPSEPARPVMVDCAAQCNVLPPPPNAKSPATSPNKQAASRSVAVDGASAHAAVAPMSDAAMAGWIDAVQELLVAEHAKDPDPRKCRFRIPELLARDELPKVTLDPKSAGTALKNDGRFQKFGRPKGWGLASLAPGGAGDKGGGGAGALGREPSTTEKRKAQVGPATLVDWGSEDRPAKKHRGRTRWKGGTGTPKKAQRRYARFR